MEWKLERHHKRLSLEEEKAVKQIGHFMNKQTPKYIEHVTLAITFIDNLRQFLRKKDLDAESQMCK